MVELLNCPMCGNQPRLVDLAGWEVLCKCGVSLCLDGPEREPLIEHWNRRASPPSPSTSRDQAGGRDRAKTAESRMDTGFAPVVEGGPNSPSTAPTVDVDERADPFAEIQRFGMAKLEIGHPTHYRGEFVRLCDVLAALASKPPAREAAERQSVDTPEFRALMDEWVCAWTPKLPQRSLFAKIIAHIDTWGARRDKNAVPALDRYKEFMRESEEPDPLERLRFFCSLAMSGRDWLDVEPFFDALIGAAPAAGNTAQPGD